MVPDPNDVDRLFSSAEEFADTGHYEEALSCFQAAWNALPEPIDEHELTLQILAGIADCYFFLGAWDQCREVVQNAFRYGADLDNPFFRLRLGQSLFELGDQNEAANWLVPVYLAEGRGPFESDDPKYLEFFRSNLKPPSGGWLEGW
jgi:tetratricopeptide (TPR) repeat protein